MELFFSNSYDPTDCTEIYGLSSALPSGFYRIKIPILGHVTVVCEMEIDGGGWTVISAIKLLINEVINESTNPSIRIVYGTTY